MALEQAKKRFGQDDVIINKHLTKVLNLKEVSSSNHVGELRGLYDKVNLHVRSLEALGVKQGAYAVLLHTALQKQLPKDLVLRYHQLQTPDDVKRPRCL